MAYKKHKKPNDKPTPTHIEPTKTNLQPNVLYDLIIVIISVSISLTAGILSWKCNVRHSTLIRVILFIFAFSWSEVYLSYYLIYRVIMGNSCSIYRGDL